MGIVYGMTCMGDAVMLYGGMLYGLMIRCCMVICNCASRAVLLLIIDRDVLFWPGGSGLETEHRHMFGRGRFSLDKGKDGSVVNRVLA